MEKIFQERSHFWAEDVAQLEECLPRMHRALGLLLSTTHTHTRGMAVPTCDSSTWEIETTDQ